MRFLLIFKTTVVPTKSDSGVIFCLQLLSIYMRCNIIPQTVYDKFDV